MEIGATVNYNQYSVGYAKYMGYTNDAVYGDDKVSDRLLSIGVPIDLAYKIKTGIGVVIEPYFGMNLKLNVMGITKDDYHEKEYNWFSEDDYDATAKRVQIGGLAGVRVGYKFIDLSFGYYFDSPLQSIEESNVKVNTNGILLGVGFSF